MQSLQQQIVELRPSKATKKQNSSAIESKVVPLPISIESQTPEQPQPPLPPLKQSEYQKIREVAMQAALITAQRFLDNLPDDLRNHASKEQLGAWQNELVAQLQPSLSSELSWSLHRVWLEVRESSLSRVH